MLADFMGYDLRAKPTRWKGEPYTVAQEKADGHRYTLWGACAFGRKPLDRGDELRRCCVVPELPEHTIVDGELYVPGGLATDVASALAGRRRAAFTAFALPFLRGEDMREATIDEVDSALFDLGFTVPLRTHRRETYEGFQELARMKRIEGFVLKAAHYRGWYKVKADQTLDAIIVGTVPGKGKHAGRHGALLLALADGTRVGKCGIGNDDQWRDRDVLGLVAEFRHEGIQRGAMRFPRFERWREDKPKEDCRHEPT